MCGHVVHASSHYAIGIPVKARNTYIVIEVKLYQNSKHVCRVWPKRCRNKGMSHSKVIAMGHTCKGVASCMCQHLAMHITVI